MLDRSALTSRNLLNRRTLLMGAGAVCAGTLTGARKLFSQGLSGKLTLAPLPDPLEKCNLIWDASDFGYRVDEYLVSGSGPTFAAISDTEAGKADRPNTAIEWGHRDTAYAANLPADFSPRPQTGTGSYTTRIIVYRPRDSKKFSGNVIVEPVHPAGGIEVFSVANRFFLTRGDAVVHIDTPGRFPSTKKFSPERYDRLSMPDRSLFWTSISQIATLLKVGGPDSPLPVPAGHLYMTGYSGSADTVYTFLSYHHKLTRTPDGKPVFSGYLPLSHLMPVPPIDAVIVTTATQSDMFGATDGDTPITRAFRTKFNSDAPGARRRRYELPGAFHAPFQSPQPGMAIPLRQRDSGMFAACMEAQKWPAESQPDHVPNRAMLEACFHHASRWAVDGVAPPIAPLIETDAEGTTLKDADGNVKGGLRFPDIAIPVETFISAARGGTRSCASTGYSLPFSREKLVALYGSREQYLARYNAVADRLVKDGYILPEGAAQLKSDRRWLAPVF
jgi:hypothetical protein